MNVTESGFKNRQLHIEDYLQMVSAEQKDKPNPVRRVEIPKETKESFGNSYGFRSCKGAHDVLKQCQTNVNDGYLYVVDMGL